MSEPERAFINARLIDPAQELDTNGSLLVRDGKIAALFVEDFDDEGDPFSVSGAPQLLEYLEQEKEAAE